MNLNNGVLDGIRRIGGRFRDVTVDGGLPGAPLGLRLRGATTSGAPTAGTWKAGDHIEDRSGGIWICTAAGTPGTWRQSGGTTPQSAGLGAAGLGLGLLTVQPYIANSNGLTMTAQRMYVTLVTAAVTQTVTTLGCIMQTAGATAGTGINGMAVFSSAGTLLQATGDMTTAMETPAVPCEGTLASGLGIVQGTNYYLGIVCNFTGTSAKPYCTESAATGQSLINGWYLAGYYNSQTSFTSFTPSSMNLSGAYPMLWAR